MSEPWPFYPDLVLILIGHGWVFDLLKRRGTDFRIYILLHFLVVHTFFIHASFLYCHAMDKHFQSQRLGFIIHMAILFIVKILLPPFSHHQNVYGNALQTGIYLTVNGVHEFGMATAAPFCCITLQREKMKNCVL